MNPSSASTSLVSLSPTFLLSEEGEERGELKPVPLALALAPLPPPPSSPPPWNCTRLPDPLLAVEVEVALEGRLEGGLPPTPTPPPPPPPPLEVEEDELGRAEEGRPPFADSGLLTREAEGGRLEPGAVGGRDVEALEEGSPPPKLVS